MKRPHSRAREALSCFSRLLNVLFFKGDADISLSARAHRDGMVSLERRIDWFFSALTGEEGHCRAWWDVELGRSQDQVSIQNARVRANPDLRVSPDQT
jgi:hypothetical protein